MERAAHDSRRAARHLPVWALKGVILKLDYTCVIITRTETQSPPLLLYTGETRANIAVLFRSPPCPGTHQNT